VYKLISTRAIQAVIYYWIDILLHVCGYVVNAMATFSTIVSSTH